MRPGDPSSVTLTIHTGLAHFRLVRAIREVDAHRIQGEAQLNRAPLFAGLECLAQLGALHVRYLLDFQQHAFLLKIQQARMPGLNCLQGNFQLTGGLLHRSARAFRYHLEARNLDNTAICGDMLFAVVDYDHNFSRELLQTHYRNLFADLCNSDRRV